MIFQLWSGQFVNPESAQITTAPKWAH